MITIDTSQLLCSIGPFVVNFWHLYFATKHQLADATGHLPYRSGMHLAAGG